jgi:hypothetical protein
MKNAIIFISLVFLATGMMAAQAARPPVARFDDAALASFINGRLQAVLMTDNNAVASCRHCPVIVR